MFDLTNFFRSGDCRTFTLVWRLDLRGGIVLTEERRIKEKFDSKRWVTPYQVIGLSDYLYLHTYCHLRNAERSFRLDRIVEIGVEG